MIIVWIWLLIGFLTSLLILGLLWYKGVNIIYTHIGSILFSILLGPFMLIALISYHKNFDELIHNSKNENAIIIKGRKYARVIRVLKGNNDGGS